MKLLLHGVLSLLLLTTLLVNTSPARAISETVVIYQLQTAGAGVGTATQEIVVLYNVSDFPIEISDWCLEYSSSNDNVGFTSCFEKPAANVQLWLNAKGFMTVATEDFVLANTGFTADIIMSGGMAANGGHMRLLNEASEIIDTVGWGGALNPEGLAASPHATAQVLSRDITNETIDTDVNAIDFSSQPLLNPIISGLYELEVEIDVCPNIDGLQVTLPAGYLQDENGDCIEDACLNIDGLQQTIPNGYELDILQNECVEIPLEDRVLFITELLPNPPSYDTDLEYIEIYNPNSERVGLAGYEIQVGPTYTKSFIFSEGFILPNEYLIFTDAYTNITLPNTNGVSLRLVAPSGDVVSESEIYSNAGDDVSWALLDNQWIFTNQITPAAANLPYLESAEDEVLGVTSVLAPCPAGKYRNPETNRCRNIETAVSQLKPCDEDEYRNPETNRCRKVQNATSLQPCAEGQERNPETNRCRKVSVLGVSDSDNLPTITDVTTESTDGSINWSIIAVTLLGTIGYMLYEWRSELGQALVKVK